MKYLWIPVVVVEIGGLLTLRCSCSCEVTVAQNEPIEVLIECSRLVYCCNASNGVSGLESRLLCQIEGLVWLFRVWYSRWNVDDGGSRRELQHDGMCPFL